ncbi:hypothetical protein CYMTET_24886 [Cymbomonas tetramitiformis]|uniref:Uncharacterized protein n=1 Tax=Cymbomonas tetramitiformis TaxID=36881 RepID=A0AAE0FWF6_9CHLO|nr:hypothetical protein CYMTET_24886 [Cymbomonas tetramitiformis]
MFVDEIVEMETNGCRVWDVIENKPFSARVKLYKVIEDFVGLTDAGNVYGTNAKMGCSKCWLVGTTKRTSCMEKTIYAQMLQHDPDTEPAMRTDEEIRELQQLHDGMIEAGMHPDVIKEKMAKTGVKGSKVGLYLSHAEMRMMTVPPKNG